MNVGELLELLEDVDPGTEPRIAHQPNWPLALTVAAVRAPGDDFPEETECPVHEGFCIGHTLSAEQAAEYEDGEIRPGDICDEEPEDDERGRRDKVWIVGMDHPYDESPYAPRWVFEE